MQIPWQELDDFTLINLIEFFVLREGTDYGEVEKTLNEKVDKIKAQLIKGEVVIIWSELHETFDIIKYK